MGIRGSRVQGVMNELAGERIDIVLWDEDPEEYVRKAMAPAIILQSALDADNQSIDIAVAEEKLPQAVGRGGQNVRLASELTGWKINVLSEKEFQQRQEAVAGEREAALADMLAIEETLAGALNSAGYQSPEDIAYAERDDLLAVEGLGEDQVDSLMERAADYLLTQAFVAESDPDEEMQMPLSEMEDMDEAVVATLLENGLQTREDLAELALDELMKMAGLEREAASALILKAREPWFR